MIRILENKSIELQIALTLVEILYELAERYMVRFISHHKVPSKIAKLCTD